MLTIFASDILHVGAGGFGLLQSARGLGAVIGSSLFIAWASRGPGENSFYFGDSLWDWLRAFRPFSLVPAFLALITFVALRTPSGQPAAAQSSN